MGDADGLDRSVRLEYASTEREHELYEPRSSLSAHRCHSKRILFPPKAGLGREKGEPLTCRTLPPSTPKSLAVFSSCLFADRAMSAMPSRRVTRDEGVGTHICLPPKMRRCWAGGMPSFSSTRSLMRWILSVCSMSSSISVAVLANNEKKQARQRLRRGRCRRCGGGGGGEGQQGQARRWCCGEAVAGVRNLPLPVKVFTLINMAPMDVLRARCASRECWAPSLSVGPGLTPACVANRNRRVVMKTRDRVRLSAHQPPFSCEENVELFPPKISPSQTL